MRHIDSLKVLDIANNTISKYNMLEPGDKVVIGVSGGPDSLCLLHLLNRLKADLGIDICITHINHGVRGISADEDEEFVKNLADDLKLPIYVKYVDIKKLAKENGMTLEEAGREVRYAFFNEVLAKTGSNKIAVGHNKNDNIETLLLNLLRGAGTEGLKGIDPVRGNIIRPLIRIDRKEIEQYCRENNLNPRLDQTNNEAIYTRNKIRINLIPYLKDNFNHNIVDSLDRTAELISDDNEFLQIISEKYFLECVEESQEHLVKLNLDKFNKLHYAVRRRLLRLAIERVKGNLRAIQKIHIEQAVGIAEKSKTGSSIDMPCGIVVRTGYGHLDIMTKPKADKIRFSYVVPIPGKVEITELSAVLTVKVMSMEEAKEIKRDKMVCMLDRQKAGENLVVRNRRDGDVIKPSGMAGTKKLKDYFIDEKVPREGRLRLPLIAAGSEIIWVIGMRYSREYRVTNQTKEVLVLEYAVKE